MNILAGHQMCCFTSQYLVLMEIRRFACLPKDVCKALEGENMSLLS